MTTPLLLLAITVPSLILCRLRLSILVSDPVVVVKSWLIIPIILILRGSILIRLFLAILLISLVLKLITSTTALVCIDWLILIIKVLLIFVAMSATARIVLLGRKAECISFFYSERLIKRLFRLITNKVLFISFLVDMSK